MTIAALAEPALMLGLFACALAGGSLNLGVLVRNLVHQGPAYHPSDLLALVGLFIIVVAETGRVPVDNPATHLELTMIHEAMVLEYAGPDLALVEWASALKELLYLTLLVNLFLPLAMPSLVAVMLFSFLTSWNEFLLALMFTQTPAAQTMPIIVASFTSDFTISFSFINAAGVVAIIPPVILAVMFERYIVSGLTAGAVKG